MVDAKQTKSGYECAKCERRFPFFTYGDKCQKEANKCCSKEGK